MELLSAEVKGYLNNSSMIRRMFEAGIELKKRFGADKVYDFSLGNPDLPPPPEVKEALKELTESAGNPFSFGYMPNAGSVEARQALANLLKKEQNIDIPAANILVTCGAAGGINAFFRAVLERGDEVICPSPPLPLGLLWAEIMGTPLLLLLDPQKQQLVCGLLISYRSELP